MRAGLGWAGLGAARGAPAPPFIHPPCLSAPLQPPSSKAGPKEISLLDLDDCEWLPGAGGMAVTVALGKLRHGHPPWWDGGPTDPLGAAELGRGPVG